jgi:hypothetical protein
MSEEEFNKRIDKIMGDTPVSKMSESQKEAVRQLVKEASLNEDTIRQ